jgi:acetylglutamate kinase
VNQTIREAELRSKLLIEALPYIQKYNGKTIVIKYGGAAMTDERLKGHVMRDIVLMSIVGMRVVLVHGGGPEINKALEAFGKESVFVDGLRYTDAETAEIVAMVLAGKVNKSLVSLVHKEGGRAVGLSGVDGAMLRVKKWSAADLGFVGDIVGVNVNPVELLLGRNVIPIIATVGVDDEGQVYNINADTAAGEIAAALGAEKLITLTDVRGILQDPSDEDTLITNITVKEIPALIEAGTISGGMIPKVESCAQAIDKGVKSAVIIDGRIRHSILLELLSDTGVGTLIH